MTSTVVGGITFPVLLGLAQSAVFKPLRITCGSGVLPALMGGASVCIASCVASLAMIKTCSLVQKWQSWPSESSPRRTITFSTPELLLSTVFGAVVFRALGGRYSSALPSSLLKPGAFAKEWIPAKGPQYATPCEKDMIQQLGRKHGCHTCGRRLRLKLFIADHQPPSKTLPLDSSGILQKFYPHCQRCASIQGGVVSGNNISRSIRTHYLSLRLYHLFVPVPFGIAYLKTGDYDTVETASESHERIECTEVAAQTEDDLKTTLRRMVDTDLSSLITNFPLLIIWRRVMRFLDSFHPIDGFHITLWMFGIVAVLGTL